MRSPVSRFRSITGPYNSGRSVGLVDTRPYADLVGSARESQWCPTVTHTGQHDRRTAGDPHQTFPQDPVVAMSEPKSLHGLQQVLSKRMNRSRTGKS